MVTGGVIIFFAAIVQEVFASITFNGVIPAGGTVVILKQSNQSGLQGIVMFKFSAPEPGAYVLNFCIGPPENPCGTRGSYVVEVPAGQEKLAVVNANFFASNVLTVSQGTNTTIPFGVTME